MTSVLVTGMHRSGTSLVTGLLNLAGAYIGETGDLMAADANNPKGYWERIDLAALNEKFLRDLGGDTFDPPYLPSTAAFRDETRALVEEATSFVGSKLENQPFWAMKDPRLALILPVWRAAVPDARYIVCVRNPLGVAASMEKRNGHCIEYSGVLWHIHTLRALMYTDPDKRLVVHYEKAIDDPAGTSEAIAAFVGDAAQASWQSASLGDNLVDKSLQHHRKTLSEAMENERLLPSTRRLYQAAVENDTTFLRSEIKSGEAILPELYAIAHAYAEMNARAIQQSRSLGEAKAALSHTNQILSSRTHRLAAQTCRMLINFKAALGIHSPSDRNI